MRVVQCSFCQHDNPPDAKFCNACGGPLHLAPCPHCGAVNDATASTCHQCSGKLPGRADGGAPPLAGVRKSTAAGSVAAAKGASDPIPLEPLTAEGIDHGARISATLQQLRQLVERSDAEAAAAVHGRPVPPVPHPTPSAGAGRAADPRPYPVSTVTESWVVNEPRRARRGRWAAILGSAALAILAASGYYVYRWVADSPPVADNAGEGGGRVAAGTLAEPGSPNVAAPAGGPTPSTPVAPGAAAPAPSTGVPPVRPGTATPGDARGPGKAAIAGSAGTNTAQGGGGADAKSSSPGTAPASPPAVVRPRTIEAGAAFELQRPRVGPCTEAVAALGLCTREPAQGRE